MGIILGILLSLLLPALVVLGVVWLIIRFSKPKVDASSALTEAEVRKKVAHEIRTQSMQYKTATQKRVVEEMAQTVEYFALRGYDEQPAVSQPTLDYKQALQSGPSLAEATQLPATVEVPYETPWKKLQLLDSATILLYLGAFFVLASIGLYVGLGSGTSIKAVLVTMLTIVFYVAGIVLYKKSKRLKPAGITFAAIGMATLPIAGAATYYYALHQTGAAQVWLLTSLCAIAMYVHSMVVLRSSLVSYMVVFSSLSIVLSSMSSVGLAPYYFIQGIGICGLVFVIISRFLTKNDLGLQEAYGQSSIFLVPFSVGMSVLFVARVGWLQLALSLIVGALYYSYMAYLTRATKPIYVLLAQLMFIPSIITAAYGLSGAVSVVRALLCVVVFAYIAAWTIWARARPLTDAYRQQVRGLLLAIPVLVIVAFFSAPHGLWVAAIAMICAGCIVYASDRDAFSGSAWALGILALPSLVGFLGIRPGLSVSETGLLYVAVMAASIFARVLYRQKMTQTDIVLHRVILFGSTIVGACMQITAGNSTQVFVAVTQVLLLALLATREDNPRSWYSLSAVAYLSWLTLYIDSMRLLVAMLGGFLVYNAVLAQLRSTGRLHSWFVGLSALALPMVYGLLTREPQWGSRELLVCYGAISLIFLCVRKLNTLLTPSSATFTYCVALVAVLGYAFSISSRSGLIACCSVSLFLLVSEWVEKKEVLGRLAPIVPLVLLLDIRKTANLVLLMLVALTIGTFCIALVRKRGYEAYYAVFGIISLPWIAGTHVYGWPTSAVCAVYLLIAVVFLVIRQMSKPYTWSGSFRYTFQLGYGTALCAALIYGAIGNWQWMAVSYFVVGLLSVAISYIESSPAIIILSFILGYVSILRFTAGVHLPLNATVGVLLALSQGVYWILVGSKLATKRAAYARGFQLCVAVCIPFAGLTHTEYPIFPFALALFGLMLLHEVWQKGQSSREFALFIVHGSLLWWIFILGKHELQLYTQSTAALVGLFAYWRRVNKDVPSIINQYLWTAVLVFSIPMVLQAITSGSVIYAYLVLVEHVVLILVSIAFKRATFAWWGIGVAVASVLYQLRKLRYAALAFLGIFIISLAVYFLLRYNKPDATKK